MAFPENKGSPNGTFKFILESKRRSLENLRKRYPDAQIIDVTSRGIHPWVKFSPFYPHGNIPVPFSPGITAQSVEGIWQGLKVFARADVDVSKFNVTTMAGIKRSSRTFGAVVGHRAGINGATLLSYRDARYQIYLPTYQWTLTHYLLAEIGQLIEISKNQPIVLLDYETNADVDNLAKPLSHAALIINFVLNNDKTT